jgi:hypothetical protein
VEKISGACPALLFIMWAGDSLDGVHVSDGKSALTLCRYMKFLMMLM